MCTHTLCAMCALCARARGGGGRAVDGEQREIAPYRLGAARASGITGRGLGGGGVEEAVEHVGGGRGAGRRLQRRAEGGRAAEGGCRLKRRPEGRLQRREEGWCEGGQAVW